MAPQYPVHQTRSATNPAPTAHSLALLSHALNELRSQCPQAPQVGYNSPAGAEFSRLALSGSIVWDEVRAALNRFYADCGQVDGPALAGDFGLELVCRCLRRFERYSVSTDDWEASTWCRDLERGVWELVKQLGGHQTTMTEVEEQNQPGNQLGVQNWRARGGDAKGSGAEYGRQGDPFASHEQNGNPHFGGREDPQFAQHQPHQQYHNYSQQHQGYGAPRPPVYHDARAGSVEGGGRLGDNPSQQQSYGGEINAPPFSRGASSNLGPEIDEDAEEDVKPRVGSSSAAARGASETPKKEKDRMVVGSLVQAKMFDPRDKNVWWPCMVFESTPVPAGVLGKPSSTTYLVAPLPVKNEWHWVPPSRLRPIATSRIAKTLGEADSALATLQAQNHTAQADPYLSLDPAKKALAEGLAKKVKEAEQSVQAWRMIQGAQADVEGEGAWLDRGRALDEWKEERKKLQAAGGRGEEEEGSPGSGYKSEGRESVEIGSPLTPATEHEPPTWCLCGQTIPGETLIGCDAPDCRIQWYHPHCVGLVGVPKDDEEWTCTDCSSRSQTNGNGKRVGKKQGSGGGKRKA